VDNGMGSKNNQVHVKASDFEVFEALAMDSVSTGHNKSGEFRTDLFLVEHRLSRALRLVSAYAKMKLRYQFLNYVLIEV
jgi:hypothetical protein